MSKTMARVGRALIIGLLRLLVLLVFVLVALIVALLPISTTVPAILWILFALADVARMVALFKFKWTWRPVGATIIGAIVIVLLAVWTSQLFAFTPPSVDANGKPIPGSIATLEKVKVNGSEQWVTIRGKDSHKPVLLFLAGGPGGSQLVTVRRALAGLEHAQAQTFVVNIQSPLAVSERGSTNLVV